MSVKRIILQGLESYKQKSKKTPFFDASRSLQRRFFPLGSAVMALAAPQHKHAASVGPSSAAKTGFNLPLTPMVNPSPAGFRHRIQDAAGYAYGKTGIGSGAIA
ncbi:hypothetical protein AAG614_10385 [Citromicrobium bathyomarinum]